MNMEAAEPRKRAAEPGVGKKPPQKSHKTASYAGKKSVCFIDVGHDRQCIIHADRIF